MKPLKEILQEDIRQRFTAIYQAVGDLRSYIERNYGINDPDIFEETQRDPYHPKPEKYATSFVHAYSALTDVERAIFRIIIQQAQAQQETAASIAPRKFKKKK